MYHYYNAISKAKEDLKRKREEAASEAGSAKRSTPLNGPADSTISVS